MTPPPTALTFERVRQVSVGEEDLGVLTKVLLENIGEGSREHRNAEAHKGAPGDLRVVTRLQSENLVGTFRDRTALLVRREGRARRAAGGAGGADIRAHWQRRG